MHVLHVISSQTASGRYLIRVDNGLAVEIDPDYYAALAARTDFTVI